MKTTFAFLSTMFLLTAGNAFSVQVSEKPQSHKAASSETLASKVKPYPLKTCIVSGDDLGEMGDPFVFTYKGQEIKLCCKPCKKDFDKDPAKYLKLLEGK